ncbi:Ldh family oxidoreductase [Chloroflexota bacterium]
MKAKQLVAFATEAFKWAGMPEADACTVADALVEADLRGKETHGITRLASWIKMLTESNMNSCPTTKVVRETPSTAVIDADNAVGVVACARAMNIAIEKASQASLGAVGVRNSTHCGALFYFPMMALPHGMIGFMTSNAAPAVPAYGGTTRCLSTNPHCWVIPAGKELPIVLDMACTVVAGGKIRLAAKKGERIPLDWALDKDGVPTDDPQEAMRDGSYQWLGGAKGYGLAVVADILAGVLTGGGYGLRDFPPFSPLDYGSSIVRQGHFLLAINIRSFMPLEEFTKRMDQLIKDIKASKLARGFTRVYLPGEQGFEKRAQRLELGIPIGAAVWDELQSLRTRLGLKVDLL